MQKAESIMDKIYDKGQEKLEEGIDNVREKAREKTQQAQAVMDDISDYVRKNPLSSLAWAAAAGVALGTVISRAMQKPGQNHPLVEGVREGVYNGEKTWNQMRGGLDQIISGFRSVMNNR